MAVLTVSQINRYLASRISGDRNLAHFLLRGEISNFRAYPSGHCYFSLKDESSVIRAVMFRRAAALLRFQPEDGMKVVVSAGLTVYERDGIYQLNVTDIQPEGAGAAAVALAQRKEKLRAAGLFEESSKRPLPPLPQVVGVVTSSAGAALQDILHVLGRRCPLVQVKVFPVQVQGDAAAASIAAAVRFAGTQGCDVLIVGRGGGAAEDLDVFNAECVAYAIHDCPVPVISAVGHETDVTIADAAADRRAPTPSAAAELAVPDKNALHGQIRIAETALRSACLSQMAAKRRTLEHAERQLREYRPDYRIRLRAEECRRITERLRQSMQLYLARKTAAYTAMQERLGGLDPLRVLERGYAAVYQENGALLTSVREVQPGAEIRVRLADGTLRAKVEENDAI